MNTLLEWYIRFVTFFRDGYDYLLFGVLFYKFQF